MTSLSIPGSATTTLTLGAIQGVGLDSQVVLGVAFLVILVVVVLVADHASKSHRVHPPSESDPPVPDRRGATGRATPSPSDQRPVEMVDDPGDGPSPQDPPAR